MGVGKEGEGEDEQKASEVKATLVCCQCSGGSGGNSVCFAFGQGEKIDDQSSEESHGWLLDLIEYAVVVVGGEDKGRRERREVQKGWRECRECRERPESLEFLVSF
jgi:hypothetical protein